jgi:hypothetical protein
VETLHIQALQKKLVELENELERSVDSDYYYYYFIFF